MIRNILFDFGDVFLNLDKPATEREMKKWGYTGASPHLTAILKAYEKGVITTADFLKQIHTLFPDASNENLIQAWNAILLDFPENRLTFVEQLAKENKLRLFLLSNTNELHIDCVKTQMGESRYNRFKSCFEGFYLSHQMKMRKPDSEIFEFILEQHKLIPRETLFIDDTLEHISSAQTLGIQTWHLQIGDQEVTQLKSRIH